MKITFSKLSIFLLGITSLILLVGCQSQPGAGPEQLAAATARQPAPEPTLLPTPAPPVEAGSANTRLRASSYELVADFSGEESGKLSDIVFYPPRETLFAVRDNGQVVEIKSDGSLIREQEIREDADFEGITYNPDTGMLYVVVEG